MPASIAAPGTAGAAKVPRKERRKKDRAAFKQKTLSNTISTGGGGGGFETRIQAVRLLALLTGELVPEHRECRVIKLLFQAKKHQYETDDLVCIAEDAVGQTAKALLQAKRTLTASEADDKFFDAISGGWLDYNNPAVFAHGRDTVVVVYDTESYHKLAGARRVTQWARASTTLAEFENNFQAGACNEGDRKAVAAVTAVIADVVAGPVHPGHVFQFLKHLQFIDHRLTYDEGVEHTHLLNQILRVVGQSVQPTLVWGMLVSACQQQSVVGGAVGLAEAERLVGVNLANSFRRYRNMVAANTGLREMAPMPQVPYETATAFTSIASDIRPPQGRPSRVELDAPAEAPAARSSSLNKLVSAHLDAINDQIKSYRYSDALASLEVLGKDQANLDDHQQARWHFMRGNCRWHTNNVAEAIEDFLKCAELCDDEDRFAAAKIRALMLQGKNHDALAAGNQARERFPGSVHVWLAYANVRLVRGDALALTDAPTAFRDEPNVLQLLAVGRHLARDLDTAIALFRTAISNPESSFYVRKDALAAVLERIGGSGLNIVFRFLTQQDREALDVVLGAFQPRNDRLWNLQAPEVLATVAVQVALGHIMLGAPLEARAVLGEARERDITSPLFFRVELEAVLQLEGPNGVRTWGRAYLDAMPEDALVAYAQACANEGDIAGVDAAAQAAAKPGATADLPETVKAIRWQAMDNASNEAKAIAVEEVSKAGLEGISNIPLLCVGARLLLSVGRDVDAEPLLQRAQELAQGSVGPEDKYLVAELLFHAKRFAAAAPLFAAFLPPRQHSDLHNQLLCCYVRTRAFPEARAMLEQFPPNWANDAGARSLAIELGQEVGDWKLLTELADAQFHRSPEKASSWLFKFMVATRAGSLADQVDLINETPTQLEGTPKELANIASVEARYGNLPKALQRMYRMRRLTLDSVDSASVYAIWHYAISETLPNFEDTLEVVAAGTTVQVTDELGQTVTVTIDPQEAGELPETVEFKQATSPEVAPLLGKRVSESLSVPGTFGQTRTFTVTAIRSAYRQLLHLSDEVMTSSMTPNPMATRLRIGTNADGSPDFGAVNQMLARRSSGVRFAFDTYRDSPITLGLLGKLLGNNVIDVVRSWGAQYPPLFVAQMTTVEQEQAADCLERSTAYVVDAATLAELSICGTLKALASLPKVYVTARTRDMVLGKLEEARVERASGRAMEVDGQLAYMDISEEDRARNVAQLESLAQAITDHCTVLPAYGPAAPHAVLSQLERILRKEEYSALLLAAELGATVFTVDGRLRVLASECSLEGVWPQAVLQHATVKGVITGQEYSMAVARMLFGNRTFVSLAPFDLAFIFYQGGAWIQHGMRRLKTYLASPEAEFRSTLTTVLDFFKLILTSGPCHIGAFTELLRHIAEALKRHKDCPADIFEVLFRFFSLIFNGQRGLSEMFPPVAVALDLEAEMYLTHVRRALQQASAAASGPETTTPVRVATLNCTAPPFLVFRNPVDADGAAVTSVVTGTPSAAQAP